MPLVDQLKKGYGDKPAEEPAEEGHDGMANFDAYADAIEGGDREGAYVALKSLIRECVAEYGGGGEEPKGGGLALLIGAKPKKG